MNIDWHADRDLLTRYRDGRLAPAASFAVEAHLEACAACQAAAADVADPERLARVWVEVVDRVERPRPTVVERLLRLLGVPEHAARLLAATPALTLPWIAAVAGVLVFAAASAHLRPHTVAGFLLLAPLVPLAGVATAFGPGLDPLYEVGVAAPLRGLRLLLLRAAAVLVVSLVLCTAGALLLPGFGFAAVAWVLPALAVTAAGLGASTFVPPVHAAVGVGGVWVVLAGGVELAAAQPLAAFGAIGQAVAVGVFVVGAAVLALRADTFDLGGWTSP